MYIFRKTDKKWTVRLKTYFCHLRFLYKFTPCSTFPLLCCDRAVRKGAEKVIVGIDRTLVNFFHIRTFLEINKQDYK